MTVEGSIPELVLPARDWLCVWRLLAMLVSFLAFETAANATCTLNSNWLSITPLSGSAGTYTGPTTPLPQPVTLSVSGTYTTDAAAGPCTFGLSFQRAIDPPATMALAGGGGSTLTYTITSSSGGGNTLLFTGNRVAGANILQYAFASAGGNIVNGAYAASVIAYIAMSPAASPTGGSYYDSLSLAFFDLSTGQGVIVGGFTVTGTVAKACTIVGSVPANDTATIPVSASGAVSTAAISRSISSVACNTPSNVQLTSQNGGVLTAAKPPAAFAKIINYAASATFAGATATLHTATNPTAAGAESGAAVSTSGPQPSGTLTVTITPQRNVKSLVGGSYSDVLQITITPQ